MKDVELLIALTLLSENHLGRRPCRGTGASSDPGAGMPSPLSLSGLAVR